MLRGSDIFVLSVEFPLVGGVHCISVEISGSANTCRYSSEGPKVPLALGDCSCCQTLPTSRAEQELDRVPGAECPHPIREPVGHSGGLGLSSPETPSWTQPRTVRLAAWLHGHSRPRRVRGASLSLPARVRCRPGRLRVPAWGGLARHAQPLPPPGLQQAVARTGPPSCLQRGRGLPQQSTATPAAQGLDCPSWRREVRSRVAGRLLGGLSLLAKAVFPPVLPGSALGACLCPLGFGCTLIPHFKSVASLKTLSPNTGTWGQDFHAGLWGCSRGLTSPGCPALACVCPSQGSERPRL